MVEVLFGKLPPESSLDLAYVKYIKINSLKPDIPKRGVSYTSTVKKNLPNLEFEFFKIIVDLTLEVTLWGYSMYMSNNLAWRYNIRADVSNTLDGFQKYTECLF